MPAELLNTYYSAITIRHLHLLLRHISKQKWELWEKVRTSNYSEEKLSVRKDGSTGHCPQASRHL